MPFAPALVRPKSKIGGINNWQVLAEQFVDGVPPVWAHADHDEYLRIPLFPYVLNPAADLALAFPLYVGLACAGQLPGKIAHLYVATGSPVDLLYDSDTDRNTGLRYWFGFAFIVE